MAAMSQWNGHLGDMVFERSLIFRQPVLSGHITIMLNPATVISRWGPSKQMDQSLHGELSGELHICTAGRDNVSFAEVWSL